MPAERRAPTGLGLLGLSFLAFVSLGLPDGLLGVAWPSIRAFFDLPLDALGALLVVYTGGYVVSSAASGLVLSRLGVGALLALSCLATAASLFGYAATPFWWGMVALGALSGLGAGAIDAGLNTYVTSRHSARTVNWLHACYGLGAALGPAIMTQVLMLGWPWQRGYGIVALGQLALAACFGATLVRWPKAAVGPETVTAPADGTLRLPVMWLGIAAFFVYTGLEASIGAWAYTLLTETRAVPMQAAGFQVSVYWGGLMAGRLVFGFVAGVAPVRRLLRGCMLAIAGGTVLVFLDLAPELTFLGLALAGFTCGPIFPSLIATTPDRLGEEHTASGVGYQVAGAAIGQSLFPAIIGIAAKNLGHEAIAAAVVVEAVALLAINEILNVVADRSTTVPVSVPAV